MCCLIRPKNTHTIKKFKRGVVCKKNLQEVIQKGGKKKFVNFLMKNEWVFANSKMKAKAFEFILSSFIQTHSIHLVFNFQIKIISCSYLTPNSIKFCKTCTNLKFISNPSCGSLEQKCFNLGTGNPAWRWRFLLFQNELQR